MIPLSIEVIGERYDSLGAELDTQPASLAELLIDFNVSLQALSSSYGKGSVCTLKGNGEKSSPFFTYSQLIVFDRWKTPKQIGLYEVEMISAT